MKKENTKEKLLQNDEKLAALQERLEQKKAARLEIQNKSKAKPSRASLLQTRGMMREKVREPLLVCPFGFLNLLALHSFHTLAH